MKDYALPIAFMLAPFLVMSTGYIWHGQQMGLMVLFVCLIAAIVDNKWIRAFLFYAIAWQTFLMFAALSHPKMMHFVIGQAYTQVLFMSAGALIFVLASRSKIALETFYNLICVAAVIQSMIAIVQYFLFDPVPIVLSLFAPAKASLGNIPLIGTLGNPNYLSAFLAFSLIFFFRKEWIVAAIPVVGVLFISKTSSAVIPAVIGTAVFLVMRYRINWKWVSLMLCGVVAVIVWYAFFYDAPINENDRFQMWAVAFGQVIEKPYGFVLGLGPGAAWIRNYPLHSEWVTLFHQFGVVGCLLAIGYFLTIHRKNAYLFSALVIMAINLAGNAGLHIPVTAFLVCLVAGLNQREALASIDISPRKGSRLAAWLLCDPSVNDLPGK
jgi:hypothetical protein